MGSVTKQLPTHKEATTAPRPAWGERAPHPAGGETQLRETREHPKTAQALQGSPGQAAARKATSEKGWPLGTHPRGLRAVRRRAEQPAHSSPSAGQPPGTSRRRGSTSTPGEAAARGDHALIHASSSEAPEHHAKEMQPVQRVTRTTPFTPSESGPTLRAREQAAISRG